MSRSVCGFSRAAVLLAAGLVLFLTACKSDQEKLVDLKFEKRQKMQALYATYGGGNLAKNVQQESAGAANAIKKEENDKANIAAGLLDKVGQMALEMDRGAFEAQCLAIGQGDDPVILNQKARDFFAVPDNSKVCREVARLQLAIAQLEQQLGQQPAAQPSPAAP